MGDFTLSAPPEKRVKQPEIPKVRKKHLKLDEKNFTAWDQLEAMLPWSTEEEVCEHIGISHATLHRHITKKYGINFEKLKAKRRKALFNNLLNKQYQVAMTGNVTMLIWLGKQYLEQKEPVSLEVKDNRTEISLSYDKQAVIDGIKKLEHKKKVET